MTKLVNETYVCFSYTMLLVEKSFYSYFWKPKSGSTANISLEMWNINPYVRFSFINSVVYWVENNIYKSNLGLVCLKKVSLPSSFSSVQPLSRARLFAISWTAAFQASLSITNSWSLLKFMSIELVLSWKVVTESREYTGILGPRRRRIQSGARDEAWSLRAFV